MNSKKQFNSAEEIKAYCIGYRQGIADSKTEESDDFADGKISALNHIIDAIED